jgi:hypothetical protein
MGADVCRVTTLGQPFEVLKVALVVLTRVDFLDTYGCE